MWRIGTFHRATRPRTGVLEPRIVVAALVAALAVAATSEGPARGAERLQACFVSLNEPDEVAIFRSHLDLERFDLVDIHPPAPGQAIGEGPASPLWILDACVPGLRCDIVVISGEFAGNFFGTRGSLSLQAMEEASCQPRCNGLFHHPREVFLLGCNTLASKDQDTRTPETYLRVLLDHGFERGVAERVVELRYGPLGPSFRESLRRVFAGVPRLYGFASVAPRAAYTAPMLERYLHAVPDYAAELSRTTQRNAALRRAFMGTAMTESTGLSADEPGARDRQQICTLYDESSRLADRLRIAYGLALRPDALRFIPTLQAFLSRHSPDRFVGSERSVFLELRAADDTRTAVLQLVRTLDVSVLQLELAHFAALVGWIERAELHALAVAGTERLLHGGLTTEAVDVICEMVTYEPVHNDVTADDIPSHFYGDPEGLRLIACVAPSDPRVAARVLPAMRASNPVERQWAAYALTQLRPSDPHVLAQLVPYLRDPSAEIAARIRWLLAVQTALPPAILRAMDESPRTVAGDAP